LLENLPRILPEGTGVEITRGSWPVLPIFELMQRIGNISEAEMFRTFNMGVGMVIVCDGTNSAQVTSHLESRSAVYEIGRVVAGDKRVAIV